MNPYRLIFSYGVWLLTAAVASAAGHLRMSKHNLSASGVGSATATADNDICVFCHTPQYAIKPCSCSKDTKKAGKRIWTQPS